SVYNILGQKLVTLVSENKQPGIYSIKWNAQRYTTGVYFFRLNVNGKPVDVKKGLYLR
ncbi:MAG: T9SS type A sorting domain-containing protein, partial [Calditrichaceae bacterium]|nr:T9SS type A sorting domain-containing protein [Calditrichaceae bacterium]